MKLELEGYDCLCATKVFRINGIEADYSDFGEHYDTCPAMGEPYGCGNMRFIPGEMKQSILDKYHITSDEWFEVIEKLDSVLSFGHCGWCI